MGDKDQLAAKRQYFRDRQREHRKKTRFKQSKLLREIQDMEALLEMAKTKGIRPVLKPSSKRDLLLPWQVVAHALKEAREISEREKIELYRRINANTTVIRDMERFTLMHQSVPSWRHVSLMANPESRRLGKSWITTQMFMNKTRMFQEYKFPPPDSTERYSHYDVVFTEECYFLIQRSQNFFETSMEAFRRMNHRRLCSLLLLAACVDQEQNAEEPDMRRQITHMGECVNLLLGEFWSGTDQCTHVVQQIQDDECWPHDYRQRNRSTWIEMTHVGPKRTKIRALSIISQSRTSRGFVPRKEESAYLELSGVATTDEMFRRQMLSRTSRNARPVNNDIPTTLAMLEAEIEAERLEKLADEA
ncbi:hypothetical protein AC1031_011944 [Aphanomyces cochlioides]|nr:hypothetical protein AC1031_011944 [Aphanomyces cochlioides]